jgi:hypothetical protein
MKSKLAVGGLLVAAVWLMERDGPMRADEQKGAVAAKAEVCIPAAPEGQCCLWRVQKLGEGRLVHRLGNPYECKNQPTARGPLEEFRLKLRTGGPPCDEQPPIIPDGSELVAKGNSIRRQDDFAHIIGRFTITAPQGSPLFAGYIEAIHRLSVCHKPFGNEPCDPRDRMQGWLVGASEGGATGRTLRAVLTVHTNPLMGGVNGYTLREASLDGVIVECHQ